MKISIDFFYQTVRLVVINVRYEASEPFFSVSCLVSPNVKGFDHKWPDNFSHYSRYD